jgi:hypothetical protein
MAADIAAQLTGRRNPTMYPRARCFLSFGVIVGTASLIAGLSLPFGGSNDSLPLAAEPSAATPQSIRLGLDRARSLLEDGRPLKARAALADAIAQLESLLAVEPLPSGVRPLATACAALREDLELEGVDVAGLVIPKLPASRPRPQSTAKNAKPRTKDLDSQVQPTKPAKPLSKPSSGGEAVSFSGQIAPLLAKHCGGCHVTGRKGNFQMASYEGLMKTGAVARGQGASSRLVEVIESGDMPRGGGRVPAEDLALLVRWIDSGAAFDGPDPSTGIDLLARSPAAAGAAARPLAMPATRSAQPGPGPANQPLVLKPGDVSFAFEIAPLLVKNCAGCHDADDPEARLSMTTFASLSRGGESGAVFVAGSAADSLLIRKVKGSAGIDGQRMPIGKPPLPAEVIGLLEKWIDQGARLDLLTPADSLSTIAAAGRSRRVGHEELMAIRFAAAEKLWRRALDGEPSAVVRRGSVCVIGNQPQSRLDAIAEVAELACKTPGGQLAGEGPIVKGGLVLFICDKPYDLSNFWQSVIGDERPQASLSLAGVAGDVVYGAIVPPAAGDDGAEAELRALLVEQVVASAFLSRAAPAWFARGAGRVTAERTVPKAATVARWKRETTESVPRLDGPAGLLSDACPPSMGAALGGGVVSAAGGSAAKLSLVLSALDAGEPFERAFSVVFRADPKTVVEAWLAAAKSGGSRRR